MKILILPSIAEGMPVVVIEAMKAGVIPLVNNINGGIQELVEDGETGYKIKDNGIMAYVKKIMLLAEDKQLAEKIRPNCIEKANALFEPFDKTKRIEDIFQAALLFAAKGKSSTKVYGSRLDQRWIPNLITNYSDEKVK